MKNLYIFIYSLLFFGVGISNAQYTVLHNFNGTKGRWPGGQLTLVGNKLFGITNWGGAYNHGVIFSIDTTGNGFRDLLDFNNTNGATPVGWLTNVGHKLYGATSYGGANGQGLIFSIDTDGNGFKDLFDCSLTNSQNPNGGLILSQNRLYGTSLQGGVSHSGNVFGIDTNGNGYKDILDFTGANGSSPDGGLTIIRNKIYGLADFDGANGYGVIYSVDTNGGGYMDMFDFIGPTGSTPAGEGSSAFSLLGNRLYGVVELGGAHNDGVIFSIDTNGSGYKDFFDFNGTNGKYPSDNSLFLLGNKWYGMVDGGGLNGYGLIFSMDTNGSGYKDLFDFNYLDGSGAVGAFTRVNNKWYGQTYRGGTDSDGVIFSFNDLSLGINELPATYSGILLFPNPSNGLFQLGIRNSQLGINGTVEVYNMLGEKIYSKQWTMNNGQLTIDLSSQSAGIYLYRVTSTSGELVGEGKLIIQK